MPMLSEDNIPCSKVLKDFSRFLLLRALLLSERWLLFMFSETPDWNPSDPVVWASNPGIIFSLRSNAQIFWNLFDTYSEYGHFYLVTVIPTHHMLIYWSKSFQLPPGLLNSFLMLPSTYPCPPKSIRNMESGMTLKKSKSDHATLLLIHIRKPISFQMKIIYLKMPDKIIHNLVFHYLCKFILCYALPCYSHIDLFGIPWTCWACPPHFLNKVNYDN